MLAATTALLLWSLLGMGASPLLLARRRWPQRHPRAALAVWSALLGSGVLSVVVSLVLVVRLARSDDSSRASVTVSQVARMIGLDALGVVLTAVVGGTAALAGYRAVQLHRRRRALRRLGTAARTAPLARRLDGVPVHVVPAEESVALSIPGRRPVIVVSTSLVELLEPDELDAVLAHERSHLSQRHSWLVGLAAWQLACTPALPCSRALDVSVRLLVELAADDAAARRHGRATAAAALGKLCATPADDATLVLRARRLLGEG